MAIERLFLAKNGGLPRFNQRYPKMAIEWNTGKTDKKKHVENVMVFCIGTSPIHSVLGAAI